MKTIDAVAFEARCLAMLDEVVATGDRLTILRHGRPLAHLIPYAPGASRFPQEALAGTVEFLGDVVEPAVESSTWEAEAT